MLNILVLSPDRTTIVWAIPAVDLFKPHVTSADMTSSVDTVGTGLVHSIVDPLQGIFLNRPASRFEK